MSDSLITQKAIAESIKALMKKKSLEKITVSDIVRNCGLNRQTFYYHFKDKYDLVSWIYRNEIVATMSSITDGTDWDIAMTKVLNIMKQEQAFYAGSLSMDQRNIFFRFLFDAVRDMLLKIINQQLQGGTAMGTEDRTFIAEFYAYGLVGIVSQWVKKGMRQPPEEIVHRLARLIDSSKRTPHAKPLNEIKGDGDTHTST